jgi:hypothetical protein
MFLPFGDDNRGKATAWSLFGNATAVARQDSSRKSTIQSLNTTVEGLANLVDNGARLTSAVAGFLGHSELATRADSVRQKLIK